MKWRLICVLGLLISLSACNQAGVRSVSSEKYGQYEPEKTAEINLQLGVEYIRRGDYKVALNRLEKAISIDPNYADAYNAMAVLHERLNRPEESRRFYEKALELNPYSSDTHNNYGQFLCQSGQWEAAHQHFMQALENPLYQTPTIPHTNAALCALRAKNYARADTHLRVVLQNDSDFPLALYNMAILNFEQRDFQGARDYLRRYLRVADHTAETLWLGVRLERAMNNSRAMNDYARLLRSQYPDSEQTRLLNQMERL